MATKPPMFDQQALVAMIAEASANQTAQVQKAVFEATLKALQGRELTIQNIRSSLKSVAGAMNTGAAKSALPGADLEGMMQSAVQGMDDALLRAVEAHRVAVGKMIEQGATMQDTAMKQAVGTVEKMEDALFKALTQASEHATAQVGKSWGAVLDKMQMGGTGTGAQATMAMDQVAAQMQQSLRQSRAAGMQAASVFAQSWGALVSGVLIGMSDALKQGAAEKTAAKTKR